MEVAGFSGYPFTVFGIVLTVIIPFTEADDSGRFACITLLNKCCCKTKVMARATTDNLPVLLG